MHGEGQGAALVEVFNDTWWLEQGLIGRHRHMVLTDTICGLFLVEEGQIYCNSTWNTVSCWPTTLAGHTASIPCPEEFGNHRWDTTSKSQPS